MEEQQASLMRMLREAGGRPVSYAALRARGVEFPAIVVCELELAGVTIGRTGQEAWLVAEPAPLREEAERAPVGAGAPAQADAHTRPAALGADGGRRRLSAWLPLIGAGIVLAASIAIIAADGGGAPGRRGGGSSGVRGAASATRTAARPAHPPPAHSPPAAPAPVTAAVALETRGHAALADGRYGNAIPLLRRALAATGVRTGACVHPDDLRCLTYAYALYDLGRALLMRGSAAAAVAVLQERLRIDNQRALVSAQLALASAVRDGPRERGGAPYHGRRDGLEARAHRRGPGAGRGRDARVLERVD